MNLCIDIGNTSTKAALYGLNQEMKYYKPFTVEDFENVKNEHRPTVLVSKTGEDEELEMRLSDSDYLNHKTSLPIEIDYKTPQTLGRDRIATAVGAYKMDAEATWLIIDLGTCLTMDLVVNGVFQGGLISPGVQMRFKAMNHFTAGLPLAELDYEQKFPGKSTEESMQIGVCESITHEINGYIHQLNKQFSNLKIVDCSSVKLHFAKEVKNKIFARPKLVVEGLNQIIEHNVKNK
ncbi:type III pantothenate kinase [Bacteroidia bacterium]|nr:type III pantothenate kinase [Bacteroidia bacterium]MDC1395565.1 type III pantothenate kinase [Bacteroidia bacterium]